MRRRPIETGPGQRYWRSRGNRRVRKARLARSALRGAAVLAVHGLVIAVALVVAAQVVARLRTSPRFDLAHVVLGPLERASEATLRAALDPYVGRNLLDLDLGAVERDLERVPWVRSARARRLLPDTIEVRITERRPAALARIRDRIWVVDDTGFVLGEAGPGLADVLPVLTGLDRTDDRELAARLARGVGHLAGIASADAAFANTVSELDLSQDDRLEVHLTDGGPAVLLDPEHAGRNVRRYVELRAEIESRVGPPRTVDLRWRDRIAVMPDIDTMREGG